MPSSTATIALQLETKNFAAKANDASTALLGVQFAAGGTGLALKGMGALARSSAAEFAVGAVAVDKLNTSLGKAATNADKLSGIGGSLSTFASNTALATTAISGLFDAAEKFSRIPQALSAMTASGVNTQTIQSSRCRGVCECGDRETGSVRASSSTFGYDSKIVYSL
jgi:hypothetical protein